MTRIPDAVAVASLDTHRLIITVPNDGPAEVACNLPRPVAASVLRQLADGIDSPTAEEPVQLTVDDVRDALAFNVDERDPALATLRDVLLDTTTTRTPEQTLAAARVLFEAHARQIATLVEAHSSDVQTRWGLNRSTRGVLTGYVGARKIVTAYADGLAAEQGAQR
ncbi:hypothetical protein [Streptomyces niveiscabiei]|uniref:Uncharacterized protein n=1 Tax=Streptomyces niveiscabiei TaxID=164115 RepID=A0ABW9I332_9ACTN